MPISVKTLEEMHNLKDIQHGVIITVESTNEHFVYNFDETWVPLEILDDNDDTDQENDGTDHEIVLFLSKKAHHWWTRLLSKSGIIRASDSNDKVTLSIAEEHSQVIKKCVDRGITHTNPDTGSVIMYFGSEFFDGSPKVDTLLKFITSFINGFGRDEYKYIEIVNDSPKGDIVITKGSYVDNWNVSISKSISINL